MRIISQLLYPPVWVIIFLPIVVFSALVFVFAIGVEKSAPAYVVYVMSAYCLAILAVQVPKLFKKVKIAVKHKIAGSEFGSRYLTDLAFRGNINIYQGMFANFAYVIFRIVVGVRYASVWFASMAVYYLVLGSIRLFLLRSYRRDAAGQKFCYRLTAWFLFLLNIPMGGMILLMVVENNAYTYSGCVIYISAMYTFYTMIMSVVNLVRYRRLGSPVLLAAKSLNFIAALMSVLGLQTAMIAEFSAEDDSFRRLMNTVTGTAVWALVIATAVYMLIRSRNMKCEVNSLEQVRQ